ncbi:MAG TPA: glycogen/starch synthase [Patescibacteria group bacterium]|nr:glycogen/starch synthase [Patescibacteria group bacterium]
MTRPKFTQVVEELLMPVKPPRKTLRVLFVASELSPYSTVGGLGRVTFFLPRALMSLGHDIRVMIPKYGKIDLEKYPMEMVYEGLEIPTSSTETKSLICNVKTHKLSDGPRAYFLENMEYYEKRANEYGYVDDPLRWALLNRGVIEFMKHSDWKPDIIHSNDWQTGLIPQYLKTIYRKEPLAELVATVYTIHNLYFQGNFDHRFVSDLDYDDGKSRIPSFFSPRLPKINSMRRGIMFADVINTVSETYAKEILTPDYGEKLDELLREVRTKLFGVLNGIDYNEFNSSTDKIVRFNYDAKSLGVRQKNKLFLQDEFNLPNDVDIPVLAISGRLDEQKGLDLLMEVADPLLSEYNVQLIVNGGGDNKYRGFFDDLQKRYPNKVSTNLTPNFELPRHIFSGADMILLPSKFEPCGMVQMEAMRYGCIPVVRATGGLADTIDDNENGFSFKKFDRWVFFATLIRALEAYKDKKRWSELIRTAMKKDFSWDESARKYVDLYFRAIELKTQRKLAKSHLGYKSDEDF